MTHSDFLLIDIGGSKLMTATWKNEQNTQYGDIDFQIRQKSQRVLAPTTSADELLELIDVCVSETMSDVRMSICDFCAIGVNIPGLAEPQTGTWVYACFSGIRNFPIAGILSEKYDKPVFIENDVNACALGEKYFGACRSVDDFLWVTVSNGVGGGLVLAGDIFSGSSGNAGEIGHFCVEDDKQSAIQCGCGNWGCLEAQAAGPGIAKRYQKLTGNDATAEQIAIYTQQGNADALAVYEETGRYLGRAIAASVNLINPAKVILGGGVSQSFDLFYPELHKTVQERIFRDANQSLIIEPTQLGNDAALAGAAAIALRGLRGQI